jgi:hypothetical protein
VPEASSTAIDYPGAPPQEAEAVGRIVTRTRHWEDGVGKDFHRKNQRLYEQYRGFRRWEHQWNRASANDRDGYVYEAKKKWGAELHIPMSFRTIETVVPRAIANAPKLLYLPRDEQWRPNVQSVQLLIDAQQEQIDIDLPFQGCMRAGQMYGLGVTKTYWDKRVQMSRRMEPRTIPQPPEQGGTHYLGEPKPRVLFDDPRCEDLDVFDFMWDPYGYDTRSCDSPRVLGTVGGEWWTVGQCDRTDLGRGCDSETPWLSAALRRNLDTPHGGFRVSHQIGYRARRADP